MNPHHHLAVPPRHEQTRHESAAGPLWILLGLLICFTATGWRLVVIPLLFLTARLVYIVVWSGLVTGFAALAVERALGPLSDMGRIFALLLPFFGTSAFLLWRTRRLRPRHVPAIKRMMR